MHMQANGGVKLVLVQALITNTSTVRCCDSHPSWAVDGVQTLRGNAKHASVTITSCICDIEVC